MTTPVEIQEVELSAVMDAPLPELECLQSLVFRKGLDLKDAVAAELNQNYHSDLVEHIKARRLPIPVGAAHDSSRA